MSASRDTLQPALLDRLMDDEPHSREESASRQVINRTQLRNLVLRDLENLFNTTRVLSSAQLQAMPTLRNSILAYGMPPVAGQLATALDVQQFEHTVAQLIRDHEPRIQADSVQVQAEVDQGLMHLHNVIGLTIRGLLWAQPYPLELAMRTEIDLETGRVALRPITGF
ncbi:type VI secretion system baseplate subunit TssE [Limnobacter sp.]|uniref:type VI secretion system baseplate subunit TssE n=1 Tax=Limnobacter sp. TaxID=2003368 RepID=UPI0035164902